MAFQLLAANIRKITSYLQAVMEAVAGASRPRRRRRVTTPIDHWRPAPAALDHGGQSPPGIEPSSGK